MSATPATVEPLGSGMAILMGDQILLCPADTIEHAFGQHADGTRGSAFDPRIATAADALALLAQALSNGSAQTSGVAIQADARSPTGRDALIVDGRSTPGAFLVKEDGGHSVLAPALEAAPAPTTLISAIALPTFDAQFVDPTQGMDPRVSAALAQGTLRTIVTFFPGRSILPSGEPVPKAARFAEQGIALACSKQAIDDSGFRAGPRFFELDEGQRAHFVKNLNGALSTMPPQKQREISEPANAIIEQALGPLDISAKLRARKDGGLGDASAASLRQGPGA